MFPLQFPIDILKARARKGDTVLDPFCGRGTTNFAARLLGLNSLGVDASPIAAAITASKLISASVDNIVNEAEEILSRHASTCAPTGEFWRRAFDPKVLESLCAIRETLLRNCVTPSRVALRGIILGALHGPKQKSFPSYFSNQCPRTYAPKPDYAIRFWKARRLQPDSLDMLEIIRRRAQRYYGTPSPGLGVVRLGDSRKSQSLKPTMPKRRFSWIITSPPYYGMRTYLPDQWLRNWFLGGADHVDYSNARQIAHSSPDEFSDELRIVWVNAASVSTGDARMVVRFGGIRDRCANPLEIIKNSFKDSGWCIATIKTAGSADEGKRQADSFLRRRSRPLDEYDVWATRQ
jgi:hypothetical protein